MADFSLNILFKGTSQGWCIHMPVKIKTGGDTREVHGSKNQLLFGLCFMMLKMHPRT